MKWLRGIPLVSLFPRRPAQWLGPLAVAAILALAIAALVAVSGVFSFAATTADPAGFAALVHGAFLRSTDHHADQMPAPPATLASPSMIVKGAGYYGTACAHCHGAPGFGQTPIVLAMRPRPQYLPAVAGQFSDRELFRIIKHGVNMSAMPAFPSQHRDDEVWSLVAFVRTLPRMTPAAYRKLAYGDADTLPPVILPPDDHSGSGRRYLANGRDELAPANYRRTAPAIGLDDLALRSDVTGYCSRCHTGNGRARTGGLVPDITMLDRRYFRRALLEFASGKRHSGFMFPVAAQLSSARIDALADYYTAQARRAPTPSRASPSQLALAERIARAGLDNRRTDACSNCHGVPDASPAGYPHIAGQHAGYLAARMRQFRTEAASADDPMATVAHRLDDRAIDAVAAYYAAQPAAALRQ
ncbi:c-type cytochrome [Sphingomonas sp. SUN019]|uniref:c-type cytochrome n=1 Tax=Sphingomonas sp. SUN019 TaxID=2937788 RepID=UPI00216459ED|nr:c-type cytochrome [Sphingomonas sp. SUN019]UVO50814.1 c-type cytochrome [Sphingomonas sp. SUN019]